MGNRARMSVEKRAKQFMPFSALPGLDEVLAMVELEAESSGSTQYGQGNENAGKSGPDRPPARSQTVPLP